MASKSPESHGNDDAGGRKQRTETACLPCRSRKRRCDGHKPTCSNCLSAHSDCQYPSSQRRRGPGKSKQRIRALEDRLRRLESNLRGRRHSPPLATVQTEHNGSATSSNTILPAALPGSVGKSTDSAGTAAGVGSSGGTGSPPAAQAPSSTLRFPLLQTPTLFTHIPERMAELRSSGYHAAPFQSMVASPIQLRAAEMSLLKHSIHDICQELPLFGTREFLHRTSPPAGAVVSRESCGSASRWACVNAAVALSVRARIVNRSFKALSVSVWAYFENAYAAFPELVLHGNGTETVQALVLMALFSQGSADARTTSLLLSTALRLSQTLDPSLFQANQGGGRGAVESEDARRAVWAAFVLDTELSLCCGLTPALGAGDVAIELPDETLLHEGDEEAWARVFKWRVQLAVVHSAVRTRLYTRDAFNMSESDLFKTILNLDHDIEKWRQKLPPNLQPGRPGAATLEPHCIILHLAFYSLHSMVHWAARRQLVSSDDPEGVSGGLTSSVLHLSKSKATAAARHTLRLLQQSPFEQFAQFWRNLPSALAAALTLLLHILECPADPDAAADAELLRHLGHQVRQMQDEGDFELSALLKACVGLEQLADAAISQGQQCHGLSLPNAPPPQDAFTPDAVQTVRDLVRSCTHPMYVAEGLLTNIPNRDIGLCQSLARILGLSVDEKDRYGPLVPGCVKPGTYGFGFET